MIEAFLTAIQNNSVSSVLGIVCVAQFLVLVYMGKYLMHNTVHSDYFYTIASKLDNIITTVQDTNIRVDEHNRR